MRVPLSVCSFVFVLFFVCLFHRAAQPLSDTPASPSAPHRSRARGRPAGGPQPASPLPGSPLTFAGSVGPRRGGRDGVRGPGPGGRARRLMAARGVRYALEPRRGASLHRPIKSSRGPGRATLSPRRGAEPRLRKRTSQGRGAQARPHAPLTPPLPRQRGPQACTEPPG